MSDRAARRNEMLRPVDENGKRLRPFVWGGVANLVDQKGKPILKRGRLEPHGIDYRGRPGYGYGTSRCKRSRP